MNFKKDQTNYELLQIVYPELYSRLKEELSAFNIHSYDVRVMCRSVDNEIEIRVMFGDGFVQEREAVFSQDVLVETNSYLEEFCEEVGVACKETLIADYFRMVNP